MERSPETQKPRNPHSRSSPNWKMAGPSSLRAAFAHASHFMSQFPLGLNGLSHWNPFDGSRNQVANAHSDSAMTEYPFPTLASSCPLDGPVSCNNKTQADSCCFVYPGGRLLLTQFWDEKIHVGGAETDWTVHGLW